MQRYTPQVEELESRNLLSAPTWSGGPPVLGHVQIEAIFYGKYWTSPEGHAQADTLKTAIRDLIGGSYMDGLASLGIGRSSLDQVDVVPDPAPSNLSGAAITSIIGDEISTHHLPAPNLDRLYLFFGPKNTTLGSSVGYNDIHSEFNAPLGKTPAYYAQIQFSEPKWTNGVPLTPLESETWGLTHEIIEAVTNPTGLYADGYHYPKVVGHENELGDVADEMTHSVVRWDNFAVCPYWLALNEG